LAADSSRAAILKPTHSRFRLVVFDLDGTLVDSRRDLAESANAVLRACGCAPHSEEAIGRMVGDGAATLVARAFATAGCAQPADALERFLAVYDARLLKCTKPYEGVLDVLATLRPLTTLAVLTNKPLASTRVILDGLGLAPYFAAHRVLGGDGPLPRKPDPAGLQYLIGEARVTAAETLVVGDSQTDWLTARGASAEVCLARYGFGFETFPPALLPSTGRFIDAPRDLLRLV
jgi:phosphoglycolate phosphatase